jgi:hypothetical protein
MTAKSRHEITVSVFEFAERYAAAQDNIGTMSALINTMVDDIIAEADESYDAGYKAAHDAYAAPNTNHDVMTNMIMRHQNEAETAKLVNEGHTFGLVTDSPESFYPTLPTATPNGFHGSTDPTYGAHRGYVNPA